MIAFTTADTAYTITLGGSYSGDTNTFTPVLANNGSGALSITKNGASVWALSGANTFTGTLKISAGTLTVNAASGLGNGTSIVMADGSSTPTLAGNGNIVVPNTKTITAGNSANPTSTSVFRNVGASGTTFEIAAKITPGSGATGPVKMQRPPVSGAIVRFSNDANDFTGDFGAVSGICEYTSVANGGTASALGKASTAYQLANSLSSLTMRYVGSGNSSTDRALSWQGSTGTLTLDSAGSGTVRYLAAGNIKSGIGSSTLTLRGSNTGDNTLAQVINDSDAANTTSVTKSDAGKWILTGANTYTGNTTIGGGALLVNGSLASGSAVSVNNNGTLGGTGTIGGVVTVNSGGTIAPGASIGTLTLSSAPSLGGKIVCELNRDNPQTADKIVFGSATTFGGTLTVVNVGATPQANDTFDLFDGSLGGSFATLNLPGGPAHWNTSDLNGGGTITFTGNTAPIASAFGLEVARGGSTTVAVIGKFATDADAGDVLTITAVSTPSHGTVSIQGGNVVYTSTDTAASDSFNYTVSDGIVTATATASVTITASTGNGANILSVTPGDGTATVTFAGIPGAHYAIERSTDLSTWTEAVADVTVPGNGIASGTDLSAPGSAFYRTRYVSVP